MKKILIADDNDTSRALLGTVLTKAGYEVTMVEDGEAALLALLEKNAPQMALLDWMMPGLDGLELCRVLKENHRLEPTYLILVTSKAQREDIVKGLDAGADDYIIKPFDRHELMARIKAGFRSLDMQMQLKHYSRNLEKLAGERAAQLVHADRMATLGLMSASITHEINNPASFVSVNTQVLEENWPVIDACISGRATEEEAMRARMVAKEVPTIFSEIRSGVSRISDIVENLKTYARSGNENFKAIKIEDCVEDALKLCWNKLKHHMTVTRNYAPDLPPVHGDGRRLEQVFVNILINAADAMDMAGVQEGQLTISTREGQGTVITSICDSGPGIPEAHLDQIFSSFFTTKKAGKGTGLGLLISRGIVKDHGGTLEAFNRKEGGAEFYITLPVKENPSGKTSLNERNRDENQPFNC